MRVVGRRVPAVTTFVVMGTANHYFLDAVAGAAVMGVGALLTRPALRLADRVSRVRPASHRRRFRPRSPRLSVPDARLPRVSESPASGPLRSSTATQQPSRRRRRSGSGSLSCAAPPSPPHPLDARALAALAANPGCKRRALLDGAGVDKAALATALGSPAAFGQSQFAFMRGNAFEAKVKADGGTELLRLLHERLGGGSRPPARGPRCPI